MRFGKLGSALLIACTLATGAQAAEPIKIGILFPTSGVDVLQGKQGLDGMQLAVKEIGGKIGDRPIVVVHEDDASNPNVGLQKARKMVSSDQVDVMTGFFNSGVTLAVTQLTAQRKVPAILANAAADALTGDKCSPWVFRLSFSNAQVADPFGPWLVKRGIKRVAIVGADFVTPRELAKAFRRSFEAAGGQVVSEAFSPFGQTNDFGPYLSQARAANPDAIYGIYYGSEAILFTKQLESFGLKDKVQFVATLGTTSSALRQAQGDSVVGAITSLNYVAELDTPENKAFQKAYQDAYGTPASEFAVMGYDSMRFVLTALQKLNGRTDDKVALANAMRDVSLNGPRGPIKIDPKTNHIVQNIYMVQTVKDGDEIKFKVLDTIPQVAHPAEACQMKPAG
jgi:branched-chain amino acid transport system substrate-binding protein